MASWLHDFLTRNPDIAARPIVGFERYTPVFQLADGQLLRTFTALPQRFFRNGSWNELNPTLVNRSDGAFGADGIPIAIAADGTVSIDGTPYTQLTIRVGLVTRNPQTGAIDNIRAARLLSTSGSRSDATLIRTAQGGIEQHIRLHEVGLSETIILTQPPPTGLGSNDWFVMETVVAGLSLPEGERDEWNLNGYRFPKPVAWDADGNFAPIFRRVRSVGGELRVYTGIPIAWLDGAAYPVTIDPDITGSTADAEVNSSSTVYATARSTSGTHLNGTTNRVGQAIVSTTYVCYRTFLKFDTSSISPDTVTGVVLAMVCTTDASTTDFDVQIVKQDWSGQDPIGAGNRETAYDNCLSGTADANIWRNTSGMSTGVQYDSGALDTAWVNTTGNTYYSLRSSRDFGNTTPTGYEVVILGAADHATAGNRPVLKVTVAPTGSTINKDVTAAGAVSRTLTKNVTAGGSYSRTVNKDITVAGALSQTESKDITASGSYSRTLTSDVTGAASITAPVNKNITSALAISRTRTSDITGTIAISQTVESSVTGTLATSKTHTSDVSATLAATAPGLKNITGAVSITRTRTINVTAACSLARYPTIDITGALSASIEPIKSVTSEIALSRTATKSLTAALATLRTLTKDVMAGLSAEDLGADNVASDISAALSTTRTLTSNVAVGLAVEVYNLRTLAGARQLAVGRTAAGARQAPDDREGT